MGQRAGNWVVRCWVMLPDPRELSAAWTVLYVVTLVTGTVTVLRPPHTLVLETSEAATTAMGVLMIVGALLAMMGGAWSRGSLERVGISLQVYALVIYAGVVLTLQFISTGNRWTQLGVISMAGLAFVIRWLIVRREERNRRLTTVG